MSLVPPESAEVSWADLTWEERAGVESIYLDSFPPEERRSLDAATSAGSRLWIARRGTDLVGFGMVAVLEPARAALLQYLAVRSNARSAGIGAQLLDTIAVDLREEGSVDGVLIEIEDPFGEGSTRWRLRFYQRCGAARLECLAQYFMADFVKPRRIPMVLLWKPLAETSRQLTGDRLRAALRGIFYSEYSEVADGDFLEDLLAAVTC